ncbi:hypothetical protein [Pseudonocardia humida]|uniref:C2H2-type domain-containing protein n=1 Tax=Pseudonocardia humida TaxID=2800819 RepID=A0ABT1A1V3_9PSEU|nr:hypothetical protein [Pseudonocardia humida]MCO1656979.1 hypothetical protein [Pseudonocardia humida]
MSLSVRSPSTPTTPTDRKYLLTGGLARCGVCGHRLVGAVKKFKNHSAPHLQRHPTAGGRGCTGTLLLAAETHVVTLLWAELDKPEFLDAVAADERKADPSPQHPRRSTAE